MTDHTVNVELGLQLVTSAACATTGSPANQDGLMEAYPKEIVVPYYGMVFTNTEHYATEICQCQGFVAFVTVW